MPPFIQKMCFHLPTCTFTLSHLIQKSPQVSIKTCLQSSFFLFQMLAFPSPFADATLQTDRKTFLPPVCLLVHPRPLKALWAQASLITVLPACYHTLFTDFITEREHTEGWKSWDDSRRVNVVLMRSPLKWSGGLGGGGCLGRRKHCACVSLFETSWVPPHVIE